MCNLNDPLVRDVGAKGGFIGVLIAEIIVGLTPAIGSVGAAAAALQVAAAGFAGMDWLYGQQGIDLFVSYVAPALVVLPPTVEEQEGFWLGNGIDKRQDHRVTPEELDRIGVVGNRLLDLVSRGHP